MKKLLVDLHVGLSNDFVVGDRWKMTDVKERPLDGPKEGLVELLFFRKTSDMSSLVDVVARNSWMISMLIWKSDEMLSFIPFPLVVFFRPWSFPPFFTPLSPPPDERGGNRKREGKNPPPFFRPQMPPFFCDPFVFSLFPLAFPFYFCPSSPSFSSIPALFFDVFVASQMASVANPVVDALDVCIDNLPKVEKSSCIVVSIVGCKGCLAVASDQEAVDDKDAVLKKPW